MKDKTLAEVIEKLNPVSQEFICNCVRDFGDRPNFYRGVLPFLPIREALFAIEAKLIEIQEGAHVLGKEIPPSKTKFIDKLRRLLSNAIKDDEPDPNRTTTVMTLNSAELSRVFSFRFRSHEPFYVRYNIHHAEKYQDAMVKLQLIGKNSWEVSAHKSIFEGATTWLADEFNVR